MKISSRTGLVAAAASLALVVSACGGGGSGGGGGSSSSASGASSVSMYGCTPQNPFIPSNTNETCGGDVIDAMFTGLTSIDPDTHAPKMAVAKSIDTKDQQHFHVTLNEDWKFHDGTPVMAKNFVDAWNWAADAANAQINAPFFGTIGIKGYDEVSKKGATVKKMSGLKVTGDYTFDVTLVHPNSLFTTILVYSAFYPLPDSFFDDPKAFGKKPVGDGPFQFVSYTPDQSIKLKAFKDYGGARKPKVDNIDFKIYTSPDAAYADVVANNLDYVNAIPPSGINGGVWKKDLKGRFLQQASTVWQGFSFPMYVKKYQNPELRIAISKAVDRKAVIAATQGGANEPATAWTPPGINGYVEGVCGDACTFDAAKAKSMFKDAGGFDGTLTYGYNADGAGNKEVADAVCASIRKTLGVDCQSKKYAQFEQLRKAETANKMTGMFRSGWQADYPSAQNYLTPLYGTDAEANDSGYSSAKFDKLMAHSLTVDPDAAKKDYEVAEKVMAKDMPVVPLWYGVDRFGWSDRAAKPDVTWKDTIDTLSVGVK